MEYTLELQDKVSGKLRQIGIANDQQLATWAKVQTQVQSATGTMQNMGVSIGSLNQRIAALRAEREWIPANNIEAIRRNNIELKKLERQVQRLETVNGNRLKVWFSQLKTSVPIVNMLTNPLAILAGGVLKLNRFIGASTQVYRERSEAETKLAQVVRNTMGVSQDQLKSVLDLTSAQQKLGVVSSGVQLAGAQELATYLTKKDSLQSLIPVMNDMLAQQYGLNASQGQATQIASMLGKVMEGQVGALSRYGYTFTDAQAQILKYGDEAQRAATLAEVVTAAVGGVNEALAQTPEGRLKQAANNMREMQERIGQVVVKIRAAFIPVTESIVKAFDKITSWFERNQAVITAIVQKIGNRISFAFRMVWNIIKGVGNTFSWLWNKINEGNIPILIITGAIAALVVAKGALIASAKLVALWSGIVKTATLLWTAAQWKLNIALIMNPIGLIIAAIVALIAIIAYVIYKTDGWGKQWRSVVDFMKYCFKAFGAEIKLVWSTLINGIMIGIDKIKLGWYRFKEAVGMGDSAKNQEMIAKIRQDVDNRKKAIVEGAEKVAEYSQKAKDALKWELSWNRDRTLSDITRSTKERLGIGTNNALMGAVNSGSAGDGSGTGLPKSTEAIATGGTRNTNIHINFKSLVESVVFNGNLKENQQELERNLAESMFRVLNMAQSSVG
jgi:hypothetical protein